MLEIKTIVRDNTDEFDGAVNEALMNGWELIKRDVIPPYAVAGPMQVEKWPRLLYAELEREVEEPEVEEEPMGDDEAEWEISRNPHTPYRCSNCGYTAKTPWPHCPECKKRMVW